MRWVAGVLSVVLVALSAALAWTVATLAVTGTPLGEWSSDPLVWWGELILAACSTLLGVAAAVFIVRGFHAGSAGTARTMRWIGLGFLAVGGLGIAAGWLGLRVPTTPGNDFLSRGELVFIIYGVIVGAFGLLVAIVATARGGGGSHRV